MKFVLHGRVATMDSTFTVVANGAVYVDGNTIVAVADRAPSGRHRHFSKRPALLDQQRRPRCPHGLVLRTASYGYGYQK